MKLRSASSSKTLCAALVSAYILFFQSAAWAQSLTASANPPSGGAGLTNSYLTGSGFAAGAITGATVHFGASCAVPAVASGPVTQVTSAGVLRRFQFLIPASLTPGTYKVWVSGTAGTTAFNTLNTPSCSTIGVTANISGTASLGAAISNGLVTVVDANGNVVTGVTASDGTFTLSAAGLTPPFLVQVVTTTTSGAFPPGTTLYSVSADGNASTHINVHVLSDLMLRSFYSAQGIDPDTAFANPQAAGNAAPTPLAVQALASLVIPAVQMWLSNAGITATPGAPSDGSINLISSPFVAFPAGVTPTTGLDAALHLITSETIDPGNVTAVTIASGTITETINPTYSGGSAITLSATTADAATGGSSEEVFTGLAITGSDQSVVSGINASLAIFENIVNTNGSALTGTELLPVYAPDFLNDGNNSMADSNRTAMNLAGATITTLQVQSIKSLNTTTNVADVILSIAFTAGGQSQSGTTEEFFKDEMGTWLLYGDQIPFGLQANSESRTVQGLDTFGPGPTPILLPAPAPTGTLWQTDIFAGVTAIHGVVTKATVSGGGNIWSGAASGTLHQFAEFIQNGQTFDSFSLISQNLGKTITLPPATPFTFNVTTASGTSQYIVRSSPSATAEHIYFSGISLAKGSGPLSSVVGQTITFNWVLPTTYLIGNVSLNAQIYDGDSGNPATLSCSISSTSSPALTATSGSISIPANMSACGLSASDTIKAVYIFLETDGVNGEDNIVVLGYPY